MLPQALKPVLQVHPHLPALQFLVEFAGPFGQTFPHEPQLFTSVCELTQMDPQSKSEPQSWAQLPLLQNTCPPDGAVQTLPQTPQWLLFCKMLVSQPLAKLPSQSPNPALQLV